MKRLLPDKNEIERAFMILHRPGDVVELRVPVSKSNVISGYFDNAEALARAAVSQNGIAAGVYLTLNPVNPALIARAKNRCRPHAQKTTADHDIAEYRWLLIDCDSQRPAEISATDAEHDAALERARDIRRILTEERGWPAPVLADSGNGGHLDYLINLPNDEASQKLLKAVLQALATRFNDAAVKVDLTVFNPSRIIKVYGTVARKGDDVPERPHRLSRILHAPETIETVSLVLLTELAGHTAESVNGTQRVVSPHRSSGGGFNVEDWIHRRQHLAVREPVPYEGGRKWVLEECPFNPEHRAPDAAIFEFADGKLGFKCLHNSCAGNGWKELRNLLEPRLKVTPAADHPPAVSPAKPAQPRPEVIRLQALMQMDVPAPEMLIEGMLPLRGASLLVGPPKSGKTIFAVQTALTVAGGGSLLDFYRVLKPGPSMLIEQDDPGATASVKDIAGRSRLSKGNIPFYLVPRVPYNFGPEFLEWLEHEIRRLSLRLCVLDSYTALRASRRGGGDIVKTEQEDMTQLDALAKRTNSALWILHHNSKGSAALDWSQQAAGTFAMAAATEAQIFIQRFFDLESAAPERLVRVRGRHGKDLEAVLRFRADTLDYEHVIDGGASPIYPFIRDLHGTFGSKPFSPKDLCDQTGASRTTAYRNIDRLFRAGVLKKTRYGSYSLTVNFFPMPPQEGEGYVGVDANVD